MAVELKMPALSPTMEKGTLAKWLVAEGDMVKAGDMIAEIETDKATMEFEAVDDGRVSRLVIPEGTDDIAVGTVIAILAEGHESQSEPLQEGVEAAQKPATAPSPRPDPIPAQPAAIARYCDGENNATPLARRIAAAKDIALANISGSGPRGKIVKADLGIASLLTPAVMAPAASGSAAGSATAPIIARPPQGVPVNAIKLSSMRKTIARRLTESKQTIPHFYLTTRCNLDRLLKLRADLNESLADRGVKLSVNDMLVKAMALALIRVPDANVQFGGEELYQFERVDISMAVAIDGGLVTPVIKDAGSLSLTGIARQSKGLAAKARDGKLAPEEYQGGTASISNLGMFGINEMFPVINPPQALILGIGAALEQPWKVDGALGLATIMAATASFDHRAIDGATAAQFMAAFRAFVEEPLQIMA
ncbi:pyruvate dehydrogenase E2 component (dihydrolipoamide acetyltransferase) [Sphingobium faniae]|nr:pyruvate dehydrogenase E2 component (dihydrolipoamide acetyltransferase) [Sphingobium faniae]